MKLWPLPRMPSLGDKAYRPSSLPEWKPGRGLNPVVQEAVDQRGNPFSTSSMCFPHPHVPLGSGPPKLKDCTQDAVAPTRVNQQCLLCGKAGFVQGVPWGAPRPPAAVQTCHLPGLQARRCSPPALLYLRGMGGSRLQVTPWWGQPGPRQLLPRHGLPPATALPPACSGVSFCRSHKR